jgi:hypothetical protein
MSDAKPPFHFIATCTQISLQSYELARLNAAAQLRRQLQEMTDQWIEAEVEARLARWALEHRRLDSQTRFDEFVALESPGANLKSLPSPHRRIHRKRALVARSQNAPSPISYGSPAFSRPLPSPVVLADLAPAVPVQSAHNQSVARRSSLFRTRRTLRRRTPRF